MLIGKQSDTAHFDEDAIERLRLALAQSARAMRLKSPDTGLTPTQATVLYSVVRTGPVGVAALAESEHLNPTMLSRVIGVLVERGLLVRTPDPRDGRSALVAPTDAGRELRETSRIARAEILRAHLEHLDEDQRQTLRGALPILEALARDLKGAPANPDA